MHASTRVVPSHVDVPPLLDLRCEAGRADSAERFAQERRHCFSYWPRSLRISRSLLGEKVLTRIFTTSRGRSVAVNALPPFKLFSRAFSSDSTAMLSLYL